MIATNLKNIARYKSLGGNLDVAIDWLLQSDWKNMPEGKHEIDGQRIFAIVQRYPSKAAEACRFEAHRDYIDIQMVISGAELMEVRTREGLAVAEPYKPDIEFYANPEAGEYDTLLLVPGAAAILFPEDAHKPCVAIEGVPIAVHKIVLKVAL